ncbi:MAG: hypothetical protein IJL52_10885 [Clostridia bacterium]|nr:hypothetical protein [Clostridia bacterium]
MRPSWAHFLFFQTRKETKDNETHKTNSIRTVDRGAALRRGAGDECRHDSERGERGQNKTGRIYAKLSIRQQMDGQL